jgi:hypothetical protein
MIFREAGPIFYPATSRVQVLPVIATAAEIPNRVDQKDQRKSDTYAYDPQAVLIYDGRRSG